MWQKPHLTKLKTIKILIRTHLNTNCLHSLLDFFTTQPKREFFSVAGHQNSALSARSNLILWTTFLHLGYIFTYWKANHVSSLIVSLLSTNSLSSWLGFKLKGLCFWPLDIQDNAFYLWLHIQNFMNSYLFQRQPTEVVFLSYYSFFLHSTIFKFFISVHFDFLKINILF